MQVNNDIVYSYMNYIYVKILAYIVCNKTEKKIYKYTIASKLKWNIVRYSDNIFKRTEIND